MDSEFIDAVCNLIYMKYTVDQESLIPKPAKRKRAKRKPAKRVIEDQDQEKECQLCHTKTSPMWRKLPDYTCVCNRCGLKYKRK